LIGKAKEKRQALASLPPERIFRDGDQPKTWVTGWPLSTTVKGRFEGL
jgi:hypothetical protein